MKKWVLLAGLLSLATSAVAADWSFYGSLRFGTFWNHTEYEDVRTGGPMGNAPGGEDSDDQLIWDFDSKSRLGARVKADKVSGHIELGLKGTDGGDLDVGTRKAYGVWRFAENASLKVGKDTGPLTQYLSGTVFDFDNQLQGIGAGYDFRPGMIALLIGGLQLAFVTPYTQTDFNGTAAGVGGDVDQWLPKLEARFDLKLDVLSVGVMGGFQTYRLDNPTVGTNPDEFDVNSWLLGGEVRLPIGAFYLNAAANIGQNWTSANWNNRGYTNNANAGAIINRDGDGTENCFSWQGLLVAGLKISEAVTFEAGGGYRSDDQDAADHRDDAWQVYAQTLLKLAPGVYLVPEIGYLDYMDSSTGADEGYEWYAGAKWQIDF
jgi:hypothetical protein